MHFQVSFSFSTNDEAAADALLLKIMCINFAHNPPCFKGKILQRRLILLPNFGKPLSIALFHGQRKHRFYLTVTITGDDLVRNHAKNSSAGLPDLENETISRCPRVRRPCVSCIADKSTHKFPPDPYSTSWTVPTSKLF